MGANWSTDTFEAGTLSDVNHATLSKYGRKIAWSYEALREKPVNPHLSIFMLRIENQRLRRRVWVWSLIGLVVGVAIGQVVGKARG